MEKKGEEEDIRGWGNNMSKNTEAWKHMFF